MANEVSLAAVSAEKTQQPVAVIGAGLDLGAGRRGVDMGPSAIRYAGLDERVAALGRRCEDWGDVKTAVPEATAVGDERMRYLPEIKATCERIAGLVARAAEEGYVPVVLGGDHSVALGTLGGMARARGPGGVLWFDAHGDLNRPERSPRGNVHGMPLAAALGWPARSSRVTSTRCRRSSLAAWRSSAFAHSIPASGRCCRSSTRRSSR